LISNFSLFDLDVFFSLKPDRDLFFFNRILIRKCKRGSDALGGSAVEEFFEFFASESSLMRRFTPRRVGIPRIAITSQKVSGDAI
jgi:hypothetical protein